MKMYGYKYTQFLTKTPFFVGAPNLKNVIAYFSLKNEGIAIKSVNTDYLMQNLKTAGNPKSILDAVGTHYKIMNNQHMMQALRSLFSLQKDGKSKLTTNELISHPHFVQLCRTLKRQSRAIEVNEIIEALKVITYVGVPSSSTITQVLLQLVRHRINQLSLQHIVFLDFLMKRYENSPLVEALRIALPLVFEINLELKLDKDNIAQLSDYLQYTSKHDVSANCASSIVTALDHHQMIPLKAAKSIVWSLCELPANPLHSSLFNKCCDVLCNDIDKLKLADLETTLSKIIQRYSLPSDYYYHEKFMDASADYIIDRNLGLETAIWTLRRFIHIGHLNNSLVKYIINESMKNPELVKSKIYITNTLVSGVVMCNSRSLGDDLLNLILDSDIIESKNMKFAGVVFATELAMLNCFHEPLLAKVFDADYLTYLLHNGLCVFDFNYTAMFSVQLNTNLGLIGKYWNSYHLLLLTEAVRYLSDINDDMTRQSSIITDIANKITTGAMNSYLREPLIAALGGVEYVLSDINVGLGFNIDNVILMRKGGYPIATNANTSNREIHTLADVEKIADGNQIIGIMAFTPNCYLLNVHRLKAPYLFMLRILEARGLSMISISIQAWSNLNDYEKIPYLMREISMKELDKKLDIL